MYLRILTAAAIFAVASAAHAASGNFERTLTVNGPADLYVSTGSGRIHFSPGAGDQIHVSAHIYSGGWSGGDDVEERIRRISANPPIQQNGTTVHIGETDDRRLFNNITIDYDISVPKTTALNARSGSGDVEVDNVGRYLHTETGSGSIRAHGVAGPAELRTGSGDIEAGGQLTADTRLQTGSGSIRLHIGNSAKFDLDAATGSGSIRVSQPGAPQQTREQRHHLSGMVNGGGPSLEAHTGSGDIEIN